MMQPESDLKALLAKMDPILQEDEYVFCSVSSDKFSKMRSPPIGSFHEAEGITIILKKDTAEQEELDYDFPSRMVTFNVHSSLNAVGFLAAITEKLAAHGISVNAISAYYHDHIFVPTERTEEVMRLLSELANNSA
ncbi:MAG: ACT domain-containing protein [Anaerolineales bacterium]|jgi:hypothetical protein